TREGDDMTDTLDRLLAARFDEPPIDDAHAAAIWRDVRRRTARRPRRAAPRLAVAGVAAAGIVAAAAAGPAPRGRGGPAAPGPAPAGAAAGLGGGGAAPFARGAQPGAGLDPAELRAPADRRPARRDLGVDELGVERRRLGLAAADRGRRRPGAGDRAAPRAGP